MKHPDIADAAVIGVESAKEATELPRYEYFRKFHAAPYELFHRAYVVHANPDNVKTESAKIAFSQSVQRWVQTEVARHKFLRGGRLQKLSQLYSILTMR